MRIDWRKIEEIFAETLERPECERDAFAGDRCQGQPETLSEVRRLLDARARMGEFLQKSLLSVSRLDRTDKQ